MNNNNQAWIPTMNGIMLIWKLRVKPVEYNNEQPMNGNMNILLSPACITLHRSRFVLTFHDWKVQHEQKGRVQP